MISEYVDYEQNWDIFKLYIDNKIKGRCELSKKNWKKLREWHLKSYLEGTISPFGFLFKMKYFYPEMYRKIECMPKMYGHYKMLRDEKFKNKEENEIKQ